MPSRSPQFFDLHKRSTQNFTGLKYEEYMGGGKYMES